MGSPPTGLPVVVKRRIENRVTGVRARTDRRSLETIGSNVKGSRQSDRGHVTQRPKTGGKKKFSRGLDNSGNIEGSYVSCRGTHVLEKAVQVARRRTSSETRGRRTASHALSEAAHLRIPSDMTSAVSPQLSRSDLVQLVKVGKGWNSGLRISDERTPRRSAYASPGSTMRVPPYCSYFTSHR